MPELSPAKIPPLLLRAKDAAQVCGLSVSTWYAMMSAGRTPQSLKLGKARLWRTDILRRWVGENCPPIDKFESLIAEEEAKR